MGLLADRRQESFWLYAVALTYRKLTLLLGFTDVGDRSA